MILSRLITTSHCLGPCISHVAPSIRRGPSFRTYLLWHDLSLIVNLELKSWWPEIPLTMIWLCVNASWRVNYHSWTMLIISRCSSHLHYTSFTSNDSCPLFSRNDKLAVREIDPIFALNGLNSSVWGHTHGTTCSYPSQANSLCHKNLFPSTRSGSRPRIFLMPTWCHTADDNSYILTGRSPGHTW